MTGARRGKTRPGRLRRLDRYLRHGYPDVMEALRANPLAVDVGIGARPHTTLELARHLAVVAPSLEVVGTDVDAARVAAANPSCRVRFATADLVPPELSPGLVRALNLLRGFEPGPAELALTRLRRAVAPGGFLVEGTSDKHGGVMVVAFYRRRDTRPADLERVVFSLDVANGFAPRMMRVRLPRTLRGRPGPFDAFIDAWTEAWMATRSGRAISTAARGVWFVAAAQHLAERGVVLEDPWGWRHGYVAVEP